VNARKLPKDASAEEVIGSATEVLFGFGRGMVIWHIRMGRYGDPRWSWIEPRLYQWAVANEAILMAACKPFGGPPSKRKPYGYSHCPQNSSKGIVFLRNPFVLPATMEITLGEELGLDPEEGTYSLIQVFPCRKVVKLDAPAGSKVRIDLEGYEAGVYEIHKGAVPPEVRFSNCRYDLVEREGPDLVFDLYPDGKEPVALTGVEGTMVPVEGARVEKGGIASTHPLRAQPSASGDLKRVQNGTATVVSGKAKVSVPAGAKARLLILAEPGIDLVPHDLWGMDDYHVRRYKSTYDMMTVDEGLKTEAWCSVTVASAGKPLPVETRLCRRHRSSAFTALGVVWQWSIVEIPEGEHELDIKVVADIKTQALKDARFRVMVRTSWNDPPVRVKVTPAEVPAAAPGPELPGLFPGHRLRTLVVYDDTRPGEVPVRSAKYPTRRHIDLWLRDVIRMEEEQDDVNTGGRSEASDPVKHN
jgi:hypothetical protein